MRIGTAHFETAGAAYRYYRKQDSTFTMADAMAKIKAGEIAIGRPDIPTGTELGCDDDGRYFIDELSKAERRPGHVVTPQGATQAQLVERGIKAAGGYVPPRGYRLLGFTHAQPKQTASLVTLRTQWTVYAQISRMYAHHLTGRVYVRVLGRGDTLDAALAMAIKTAGRRNAAIDREQRTYASEHAGYEYRSRQDWINRNV